MMFGLFLFVLFVITLAVRIAVEAGFARHLLPDGVRGRRLAAVVATNALTFSISFAVLVAAFTSNNREIQALLLWTPLLELGWAGAKAVALAWATRERLKSVGTACLATAASCIAALVTAGVIGGVVLRIIL